MYCTYMYVYVYMYKCLNLPTERYILLWLCDTKNYALYKSLILQEANGWCEEGAYDLLRKTLAEMSRKTAERSKL